MEDYDKKVLKYEIERLEKKLAALKNIPEDAKLIVTSQGENLVGYMLNGERFYI